MDWAHRRWWNGHYGRLARRDLVIFIDGDGWRAAASTAMRGLAALAAANWVC